MVVLAVGDLHLPYVNKKYLKKAISKIRKIKPDVVIQMGDLYDQYMFGRFDKDFNVIKPDEELKRARKLAEKFWGDVHKSVPEAKCIQLIGNHDVRILKQTLKRFPEIYSFMKNVHKNLYEFNGVKTMKSDRDYVEYNGVVYCHGWAATHLQQFKQPVVRAHDHQAWMYICGTKKEIRLKGKIEETYTLNKKDGLLFEVSCGMYADESAIPLNYPSTRRTNWRPAISIDYGDKIKLCILEE